MAETTTEPTILDYLNYDCWRAVLAYVPLRDIILSEQTSRRWQEVVLSYLEGVRIGINHPSYDRQSKICPYTRILTMRRVEHTSFVNWSNKLGTSIVSIYCSSNKFLRILSENCPNLEAIRFINLQEFTTQIDKFTSLRRLSFSSCTSLGVDYCVDQFKSNALKELEINGSPRATAQCLKNMKSTFLKCLSLRFCSGLNSQHFLAASERLSQLTRLEILFVSGEIYPVIHLVLKETPKLEYLNVMSYDIIKNDSFFEAVSRLQCLEHLATSLEATDENLELVTRQCDKLKNLIVEQSVRVTARGLSAMCRNAGTRLSILGMRNNEHLTDDDFVAVIRFCPNLEELRVYGCPQVTKAVLSRADVTRRSLRPRTQQRLSLRGDHFVCASKEEVQMYKELNLLRKISIE